MRTKSIKIMLAGLLIAPVLAFGAGITQMVSASDLSDGASAAQGSSVSCMFTSPASVAKTDPSYCSSGIFSSIVNIALFLIGAISVIMIIYGGIRYTISAGDAKNVTAAKDTILYAVVGLVVAIMAYAIVNFVITRLVG